MYKSISDVISFIKKLKFDIEEKNDELIIKFHIFTPDGENQILYYFQKKYTFENYFYLINKKIFYLIIEIYIFLKIILIALNLTKSLLGTDSLIKFLFEENKLIKESTLNFLNHYLFI